MLDEDDPVRARALYRAACGVIASLSADAGRVMETAEADAPAYLDVPEAHRRRIRTNNVQECCNREIKRRARVVQSFPSEAALVRLVGAVCCEASEDWSSRRYMEPSAIEGLWERETAPVPEPTEGQVSRARSRIVALSGLDEGGDGGVGSAHQRFRAEAPTPLFATLPFPLGCRLSLFMRFAFTVILQRV